MHHLDIWRLLGVVAIFGIESAGSRHSSFPLTSHFPFAVRGETSTWPPLKTTLRTETTSGSSRMASATLNDGSGFVVASFLALESEASG